MRAEKIMAPDGGRQEVVANGRSVGLEGRMGMGRIIVMVIIIITIA